MNDDDLMELTADIVGAYVSNNPVPRADIPALIASISSSLHLIGKPEAQSDQSAKKPPAVNPKKSVFPDYIISLEDGARYKSLRRHLQTKYGMTPAEYRAKWGLPHDYPMTAPSYSAARAELAKASGLGRKPATKVPEKAPRGRPKRAKQA